MDGSVLTRLRVEWMVSVPRSDVSGSEDFDRAVWDAREFPRLLLPEARAFAQEVANANPWGQAWIQTDQAERGADREAEWVRDHEATEVVVSHAAAEG